MMVWNLGILDSFMRILVYGVSNGVILSIKDRYVYPSWYDLGVLNDPNKNTENVSRFGKNTRTLSNQGILKTWGSLWNWINLLICLRGSGMVLTSCLLTPLRSEFSGPDRAINLSFRYHLVGTQALSEIILHQTALIGGNMVQFYQL